MTPIANPTESVLFHGLSATEKSWQQAMVQLAKVLDERGVHASRAVVLVPYAQLMQQAKTAWLACVASRGSAASFMPRFETTMNWATSLGASGGVYVPSATDIQLDAAIDVLTAANLLQRAGLAAQQSALAGRLVEAAWSLARVAAAQAPDQRLAWGARLATELGLGMEPAVLALELAVARIALAWATASGYPSDVLFSAQADLLVVLEGFQSEPLADALKASFGEKAISINLGPLEQPGKLALHAAQDAEDEAHRAAACVLAHLAQGRSPVALIAQDRVATRRIRAMLAEKGVALRDETGWKLSTTRAAATLMSLLRALPWDASTDTVLDWLKNARAVNAAVLMRAEIALRKTGVRFWRALPADQADVQGIAAQIDPWREALQRTRPLANWLRDLRSALQSAGQWDGLVLDAAGASVIEALRLQEGGELAVPAARMSLQDFTSWVNQTLEAASFSPVHPPEAQVVILPLSQLLGRPMQAVVLPGCDEVRLAVSPEPPGMWTPAQRELLGLPSRATLATAQRTAWNYALRMPHIDVLWRKSEGGERLMPSGFVQEVLLQQGLPMSPDPRVNRELMAQPTPQPMPTGEALPVSRLSASAYEDLRRCPYRFFALRQLRLQESDELESELGKRDFGNWLHTLLHHFHLLLKESPAQELKARVAMINIAAEQATAELGLSDSEFLPFAAIWPRVREGYLEWLAGHEATGAQFVEGEVWKDMNYGDIQLIGKIDRIDQMADGSRMVIDYKTEASGVTRERIKDAQEDTQLAFYAALLADDTLAAAYVNLGEKEATKTFAQLDIGDLRDQLVDGILTDMARIKRAAPLPALGEGKACEYCAARGLCRKDFWS
ncbi:MAG: PD-(D/E)XK nuclease family protein [Polaromonas sp.]|nr:PD-(D/E)XK nuclease family protein [Polaromonas sp.]